MKFRTVFWACFIWLGLCVSGNAAPIFDPGALSATATIITFDEFTVGTSGPLSVGIASISASPGKTVAAQRFEQYPGIFEGLWFGGGGFLPAPSYTIEFSVGVQEFGLGILDPTFDDTQLEAFDSFGNPLETLAPWTGPSGGIFSSFAGFLRASADIRKVVLTPQAGDFVGIDNVSFNVGVAVMPLPAGLPLFLSAIAAFGIVARRRRLRGSRATA